MIQLYKDKKKQSYIQKMQKRVLSNREKFQSIKSAMHLLSLIHHDIRASVLELYQCP